MNALVLKLSLPARILLFISLMSSLSANACELTDMGDIEELFAKADNVFIAEVTQKEYIDTKSFLSSALRGLQDIMSIPSVDEEVLSIESALSFKGTVESNELRVIYCRTDTIHLNKPSLFFVTKRSDQLFVSHFYPLPKDDMTAQSAPSYLAQLENLSSQAPQTIPKKSSFCFGLYTCLGLSKFWPF